jgi:uncharacterized membrane protein
MEKFASIIILLILVSILLIFGYNAIKNTQKTVNFFDKSSKNSVSNKELRSRLLGNKEIIWMKINGYAIILFALILMIVMVIQIMEMLNGK